MYHLTYVTRRYYGNFYVFIPVLRKRQEEVGYNELVKI
jgi:hypothetical protein